MNTTGKAWADRRANELNPAIQRRTNDRACYPSFGKPFLLTWGVLEVALHDAATLHGFNGLVELCKLPGFQSAANDIIFYLDAYEEFQPDAVISAMLNNNLTTPVTSDNSPIECNKINHDFEHYSDGVFNFINIFFNRNKDTIKITANSSPNLCLAVILRTWYNFNGFDLTELETWRDQHAEKLINSSDDSRNKRRLTQLFARLDWNYSTKQLILERAERWYKCRVKPGTIEAYLNEESTTIHPHRIDSPQVSREIEEYDNALGYPR